MKKWMIACMLVSGMAGTTAHAQNQNLSGRGCGTVTSAEEMQLVAKYLQTTVKEKTTSGVDSIPLSLHIVGQDNGSGYYRLENLFTVLCQLNTRYAPIGFYFYVQWPITYINNTAYYTHDFMNGYQMMSQYNVPGTANIYFVNDPDGACGYYAPGPDGIAIAKGCSTPNSTTVTHELGHYFGLPHTFSGWENGAVPANPEKVTRGAGANCSVTGDLFCDTEADYLGARWTCPYTGNKTDADGNLYHPDSSLYMGYSDDACMSRFSSQQKNHMQNMLHNNRSVLLQGNPSGWAALDSTRIVYPVDTVYSNKRTARWTKVAGADYYYVKIGLAIGGSLIKQDTVIADTSFNITFATVQGGAYSLTVTPLSSVNVCMEHPKVVNFIYSNNTTTGVDQPGYLEGTVHIFPNPATDQANIELVNLAKGSYTMELANINGQRVWSKTLDCTGNLYRLSVPTGALPAGMYLLRVTGDSGTRTEKLLVQH